MASNVKNLSKKLNIDLKTYTMVFALIFIWIIFGALTNGLFFSARNMSNLFRQMSIISFLACGMVLIIVANNIDLSVGSVVGLVSAVTAFLQAYTFPKILPGLFPNMDIVTIGIISTVITFILGIVVGLLVGLIQGGLIAYLKIPAFIVTLGGMMIFRGGVLGITQGKTIVPIEPSFTWIAQDYVPKNIGFIIGLFVVAYIFLQSLQSRKKKKDYGFEMNSIVIDLVKAGFFSALVMAYVIYMNLYRGIQNPVFLLAIVAVGVHYLANNTRFGRYTYAIGGNEEAARLSGVDIKKTVFGGFVLMGILCGISGNILTGYVAAGTTGGGNNYELDTIAACIIGGTSFSGGIGTILGAIVGSLVMASLLNGLSVLNVDIFWQYIIKGIVLILAVYIDVKY
ncbi:MAG: sugar ABC transporter permease, partial [Spirochaetes bacterium]|nr:sugar ABC transporter permease [Spirochaetota bacterium]